MSFAHLHCHTEYSLLDGSNKIKEYVRALKAMGQTAGAITDHGVMYGVIDFYKACQAEGINPVLGSEVYVAKGSRFDKTAGSEKDSSRYYHLVLLAENNKGYENLTHIVSRAFTEGYYYKPRVDLDLLREYHEGLIALTACLAGEVPRAILNSGYDEAKNVALTYLDIFGKDNFFLELQDHGIREQKQVNQALVRMSAELDIPLVATNDCHYTYADDWEAHDYLLCIQTVKKVSDTDRMRYEGGQFYVKSEEEMRSLFPYAPQAIDNTQKIADRCHVDIEFGKTKLPHFPVPEGYDSTSWLRKISYDGLKERYPHDDGTARTRMDYELSVIEDMGYVDYFLIVADYVRWAMEHDISVGPGRGSGVGSIVTYCIRITNVDPLKYGLIFERLLNKERVSMPDIDIDFEDNRREEVIEYVTEKYGSEQVVQIITFGTLLAKGVIRDVARVMDLPYSLGDQVSKLIPYAPKMTLSLALDMNPELKSLYDNDDTIHTMIDMSMRLEGLPRHASRHAAGVVICSQPAENLVPLSRVADDSIVAEFPAPTLESLGLLKMDFLGLRTLTVIKDAVRFANEQMKHLRSISDLPPAVLQSCDMSPEGFPLLNIEKIDLDDKGTLDMIGTGHTAGVFQLESAGMQSFMKELKPDSFEDIIAGIALYRPGPMQSIPQYIKGKNDPASVTYLSPKLEGLLAPTKGCIVYQEQVMQIVQQLGGYSMGRADEVRRAMSKKKHDVMERERDIFVNGSAELSIPGCISQGIEEATANAIYDSLVTFADYGFNKSHAASYAVLSMQTAFLKCYFPVEFAAALLTSVIDAPGKMTSYIADIKSQGIDILPPDLNKGNLGFIPISYTETVSQKSASGDSPSKKEQKRGGIIYSLTAIKGIGRGVVEAIVEEREAHGAYKSIDDFLTRLHDFRKEACNKRCIENLIQAGALDRLGGTRKQYMYAYAQILDGLQSEKDGIAGQMSLFDFAAPKVKQNYMPKLPDVGEFDRDLLLENERNVLGIYLSGHPLEDDARLLQKHTTASAADFLIDEDTHQAGVTDGMTVTVGGIITELNARYTKNNQAMATPELEDLTGAIHVVVFPKTYERYSDLIKPDTKVIISGRVSIEDDQIPKLLAESITSFDDLPKTVWLRLTDMDAWKTNRAVLDDIIRRYPGKDKVVVYLNQTKQMKELPPQKAIAATKDAVEALGVLLGLENVVVK